MHWIGDVDLPPFIKSNDAVVIAVYFVEELVQLRVWHSETGFEEASSHLIFIQFAITVGVYRLEDIVELHLSVLDESLEFCFIRVGSATITALEEEKTNRRLTAVLNATIPIGVNSFQDIIEYRVCIFQS
jgi:hypothetical protein